MTINPFGCPPWSNEHEASQIKTPDSYTTPRDATKKPAASLNLVERALTVHPDLKQGAGQGETGEVLPAAATTSVSATEGLFFRLVAMLAHPVVTEIGHDSHQVSSWPPDLGEADLHTRRDTTALNRLPKRGK